MPVPELERFIDSSERLSPRTQAIYREGVQMFAAFAGTNGANWTPDTVEDWLAKLKAAGVSAQTRTTLLKGLRFVAKKRHLRSRKAYDDFTDVVESPRREAMRRPPRVPNYDLAVKLVRACDGPDPSDLRDRALIVMALRTGLRRSSLIAAAIENLQGDHLRVWIKGGREISVPLDAETLDALSPWLSWLRVHGVFHGPIFRSLSVKNWLGALGDTGVNLIVKERSIKAKIPALHPHALRHFYVTESRQRGVPDWKIALRTGHKPTRDGEFRMMDRYTHEVDDGSDDDALPPLS